VNIHDELSQWVHDIADVPLKALLQTQGIELQWVCQDTTPSLGATFKPVGEFLALRQVIEGGAAHQAGLSSGDLLVACNGLRINNTAKGLKDLLKTYQPGDEVLLTAFRDDVLQSRPVRLGSPPASTCELKPLLPETD
jgi:predicted metalloprotease with PDZ domain